MLHKWKFILTNWINCYKNESSEKEQCVSINSLLNIICHLRKNISLDESKSSTLEAQTIEEFIVEKYPEFKFENGTTEASSEKDLYMAASLLLYFVCVNSKNMDVKTAMCSRLSTEDQETILKFSQYLMQCPKIMYMDVVSAITEACGLHMTSEERKAPISVAETPPALRSLHSEVRRLRAALDAEKFERAYLQDELVSTAARIEVLQKEKEQYKLEIVNLKGKISMCCGVEGEARVGDVAAESAAKFARQIEELELRLLTVQEQLDDVMYDRDSYKAKVEELKKERDKWISVSEEEATRAEQLVEQLESERRHALSLKELLTELQQHRRNAGLDISQIECDDPDASMQSLHNASICSEACANVVEVQLGEERAKIVVLKQRIQSLQDQLNELNSKTENEKLTLQAIIAEKDDDIFNLKHRVNEEIEEKNKQKSHFDDQCIRLNNEINELEQKLKDMTETSRKALEQKMEEIKTLQEEKLSLLQSLNNETTKMENTIKELKTEVEAERSSKHKLKENYESKIMKLNEKVLNRNNELVELQNNVSQNSELIEQLHLDLRSEREMKEQLANKYHQDIAHLTHERKAVELNLNKSIEEAKELQKRLLQNVAVFEEFNKEIDDLKLNNAKILQELDEKNATIDTIKMQLQDEIHYKTHLQNEIIQLQQAKSDLTNQLESLNNEMQQLKKEFVEKDKVIYALDLHLIEAKQAKDNLMEDYRYKCQEVERLLEEIDAKGRELSLTQREFEHERKVFNEELRKKDDAISEAIEKLENEISDKESIQAEIASLKLKADTLNKELQKKCEEIIMMKSEYDKYVEVSEKNTKLIDTLEKRLETENQRHQELQSKFDSQTSNLLSRLNETEKAIKDYNVKYKNAMEKKELQLQTWKLEVEKMKKIVDNDMEVTRKLEKEKEALEIKLGEEILFREKLEKEYQNQCTLISDVTSNLNMEIVCKNQEITNLKQELQKVIEDKTREIQNLKESIDKERNNMQKENEHLRNSLEKLKSTDSNQKLVLSEKLDVIDKLQKDIKYANTQLELSQKEYTELQEKLAEKEDVILKLKYLIDELKENIIELKKQVESITKEKSELETKSSKHIQELLNKVSQLEVKLTKSEANCATLTKDKEVLESEKCKMTIEQESLIKELQQEQEKINGLNEETNNLLCEKSMLTQAIAEERNLRQIIEQELQTLKFEKGGIINKLSGEIKSLISEKENISQLLNEKIEVNTNLIERLNNEIEAKNKTVNENNSLSQQLQEVVQLKAALLEEKQQLSHLMNKEIEEKNTILKENQNLSEELLSTQTILQEKQMFVQRLHEELSSKESIFVVEKELLTSQLDEVTALNEAIIQEKENVSQQLSLEIENKNKALEEKQCIMQEFWEEKTAKIRALQEKEAICSAKTDLEDEFKAKNEFINAIIREKNDLMQEYNALNSKYLEVLVINDNLKEETQKLAELLNKEKQLTVLLNHDMCDYKAVQDVIVSDKELLGIEKEGLAISLSDEKSVKDEMETEKKTIQEELSEMKKKFELEIIEKQQEIETITGELKHLKTDFRKHEDLSVQVATLVNSNLHRLLENVKKVEISKEVLESLTKIESDDNPSTIEGCSVLINMVETLTNEMLSRSNVEMTLKEENAMLKTVADMVQEKERIMKEMEANMTNLEETIQKCKAELSTQAESRKQYEVIKSKEIKNLQNENQSLTHQLNDLRFMLETKVHALNEKLVDRENATDEMKKAYELQIENLNVTIEKLTKHIRDKSVEIEELKESKENIKKSVEDSMKIIKTLEEETKNYKETQDKMINDFESERQVLKNMVSVTESVMEDQKIEYNKIIGELKKDLEFLQEENKVIQKQMETERTLSDVTCKEKDAAIYLMLKQLTDLKGDVDKVEINMKTENSTLQQEVASFRQQLSGKIAQIEGLQAEISRLKQELHAKEILVENLEAQNRELTAAVKKYKDDVKALQDKEAELESMTDSLTQELFNDLNNLTKLVNEDISENYKMKLQDTLQAKIDSKFDIIERIKSLNSVVILLFKENVYVERQRKETFLNLEQIKTDLQAITKENERLSEKVKQKESALDTMQKKMKQESEQAKKQLENAAHEKLNLENKCSLLQEYQIIAEKELQGREKEINALKESSDRNNNGELETLSTKLSEYVKAIEEKSVLIKRLEEDKQHIASELEKERNARESCQKELEEKVAMYSGLREKLEQIKSETGILRRENDEMMKSVGARDTFAVGAHENHNQKSHGEDLRDRRQVSTPTSDLTHSSLDSIKTISDLEKIIYDKNRTITALQSDITYLKTLMAESENKLLDVNRELELSNENCQQLSSQLKKIVHQKNEEIAELKKQVNKMTATENRVSQIIKLSSKYQAIILRRIAEIKSNTVLKELTNFGNTSTDNELRRSLTAGGITMEDLENFLETTDRHLKRCAEKQIILQKERDRLTEVNKINESEILNLKKFLTELSLAFKTFNSVKEVYTQKLSKVVSVQRTVRREILSLDGSINDATMCKLERGYAAIMQDLAECSMNLERWVERSISRTISPEKIKQAFSSDSERSSLATATFQNTSLDVQLDELENSFLKLLEDISRAQQGEGAKDAQAVTVMEVRAEYEDKLNRMKAKMKQLYQEQIGVFKEKQREEIMALERELQKTREKFAESSKAYEEHIKTLTTELWNVGEKFLMKKEEAEWLRKQRSGSLMSLQHIHSSGLHAHHAEPSRPSDTHSLKSLPVAVKNEKRENRGLHMSDEEGEVFDNRWLKELASTPRRDTIAGGQRLSELKWRNSLCPPHLKSSYPAETQFVSTLDEEDLKCTANGGKQHRKEVGITAYKKPGPPTPSKQAGRLSATDSELRESLRPEPEAAPARKTSTPSRLRALFRSSRNTHDNTEGTPRSRRLSNIFRKK